MPNQFKISAQAAVNRNGKNITYKRVVQNTYNVSQGSASVSETDQTVKAYRKHISANQYNYPDLIGRDVVEFYIAGGILNNAPMVNDKILSEGITYTVKSFTEHWAAGEICLYCIVATKG